MNPRSLLTNGWALSAVRKVGRQGLEITGCRERQESDVDTLAALAKGNDVQPFERKIRIRLTGEEPLELIGGAALDIIIARSGLGKPQPERREREPGGLRPQE